jgi:hypothetical protein
MDVVDDHESHMPIYTGPGEPAGGWLLRGVNANRKVV